MKFFKCFAPAACLCFILIMMGCHSHEDVKPKAPENFYTVQVSSDYATSQSDNWVMASDKDGNWLDAQAFEAGATVVLNGIVPPTNTFTLHFFSGGQYAGQPIYSIQSYAEVPVQGTWKLTVPTSNTQPTSTGTASVQLTNLPSDLNNITVSTSRGQTGYSASSSEGTTTFNLTLYEASTDFIISFFKNGQPFIIQANGVIPDSFVSIDVNAQAIAMTTQFNFDYTGYDYFQGSFSGLRTGDNPNYGGFTLSSFYEFGPASGSVPLGYVSGFDLYRTLISFNDATTSREYFKFGSPITQTPVFPALTLTENNASLSAFSATLNLPFDVSFITLSHSQVTYFYWNFSQPKSASSANVALSILPFPSAMTALFPALDVSLMKVYRVAGMQFLDGFTYADWLNQNANAGAGSGEYYTFSKTF